MQDVLIRRAIEEDVPQITRIYNHIILNSTATFDIEPKSLEDRLNWFHNRKDKHPIIVADVDGNVVGWAEIHPLGDRKAYEYSVENAIYIDEAYRGRGIGDKLLGRLLELSHELGYHVVVALIVGGNEASMALHRKFDFEQNGVMREVGWKFNQWLDVVVFQKFLNGGAGKSS